MNLTELLTNIELPPNLTPEDVKKLIEKLKSMQQLPEKPTTTEFLEHIAQLRRQKL